MTVIKDWLAANPKVATALILLVVAVVEAVFGIVIPGESPV